MAQKPKKKPVAKSPSKASAGKSKPVAKTGSVKKPAAKAKPAPTSKKTPKKPAPAKKTAVKAKNNTPSVKKAKPTASKKVSAKSAPTKAKAPSGKANGAAVKAAPAKEKPAPAPAAKAEPKKGGKTPFMPPVANVKPVPIPKVKRPVLDAAPEIVIKQVYNPKKMPPFYKKQMNRLLELRSALYDTMEGVARETIRSRPEGSDASVGGMHMGDAGSDAYDRDFALSMLTKEQDALYEINEALGRLDRGVYGVCELSGKKIPDERLEALPYTRYTREMQEQIERDNLGGKFRRPVVRSVFGLDDASEEDEDEEGSTDAPKDAAPQESSLDFMKE
jgi:RNA polymerase-binding transcription factor DksA